MKIALLPLLFLAISLLSCQEPKRDLSEAPPLTDSLENGYNTVYFTILYPTSDLEDWMNRKFAKVVVDKDIPREQNKDSVRLIVTRPKRILLKTVGDSVDVTLPLAIEIIADKERKSGKITTRRVTGELDLYLNIKPDVNKNWDIIATTTLKDHRWIKEPRLTIGNTEVGVKFIVDHLLKKELNTLTKALDQALEERVDLKRGLSRTWANVQKPMPILRKDSSLLYFRIDPASIAGNIQVTKQGFLFNLAVRTRSMVHVDSINHRRPLPPFQRLGRLQPDSNRLEVLATVPLERINRELVHLLQPYRYENRAMQLTVKNMTMQGSGERIVLSLAVEGTADGIITVAGKPHYHPQERILRIQELDYELETNHLVVNLLDKNLKEHLLQYVREKVVLDVGNYIDSLPQYLNNTINQGRSGDKFHLNFEDIAVENIEYVVNETDLQILLRCRPKFTIALKKLPVRKQLKIR